MNNDLPEGYSLPVNGDNGFWYWRGQVYAKDWLAKNPQASKSRFKYVACDILKYKISDVPTRKLVLQGWMSVVDSV